MSQQTIPVNLLTIGGADSSTGAGIQTDLLTCTAMGKQLGSQIECRQIITAVTAQSHEQVHAINPVSIATLASQWQAVVKAGDTTTTLIKIGVVTSVEQIQWLAENIAKLKRQQPCIVVVDPVLIASSGSKLTQQNTVQTLLNTLLPVTDVLTANWHEATTLYEHLCSTPNQIVDEQAIFEPLHKLGVQHVVIKGGHRTSNQQQCVDLLSSANASTKVNTAENTLYRLTQPRIQLSNNESTQAKGVRGTGCAYATAMASVLAVGYSIQDAFVLANAYIHRGIHQRITTGSGATTLHHSEKPIALAHFARPDFPTATFPKQGLPENMAARLPEAPFLPADLPATNINTSANNINLGLYPVVDSVEWIERLLPLGINTIQLRMKNATEQECRKAISRANQLCKQHQCRLFINDHWQLAIEAGCYGVHLGQEDIQQADLARIQQAGLRLGTSTHGFYELLIALQVQPSYIAIGAIFPTATKNMTGQIQGVAKLAQLQQLLSNSRPELPVTAIGGINQRNIETVLQTGVKSVAVVTAITQAPHPALAVQQLQQAIHSFSS